MLHTAPCRGRCRSRRANRNWICPSWCCDGCCCGRRSSFVDGDVLGAAVAGRGEVHRAPTGRLQPLGRVCVGQSDQRAPGACRRRPDRRRSPVPPARPTSPGARPIAPARPGVSFRYCSKCGGACSSRPRKMQHHPGVAQHQQALADQAIGHGVEHVLELRASVRTDAQLFAHHRVPARHRQRSQGLGFLALEQLQRTATDLLADMLFVALTIPALQSVASSPASGVSCPRSFCASRNNGRNGRRLRLTYLISPSTTLLCSGRRG